MEQEVHESRAFVVSLRRLNGVQTQTFKNYTPPGTPIQFLVDSDAHTFWDRPSASLFATPTMRLTQQSTWLNMHAK